mgnify:CR=1 FL=1
MKTITKTLVLVTGLGVGLAATGALLAQGPSGYMGGPGMNQQGYGNPMGPGMMGGPGMMNGGYGNPNMMQQGYGNQNPMGPGMMGGPDMMNGGYGNPNMMQQGYGNQNPMGPGMMGRPGMMRGPGMMQGGTMGPGMMGQWGINPAEKLSAVKADLAITNDQQAAWDNYAAAVQAHIALGQASHQAMWTPQGGVTGPARNNLHQAMWESRQKVNNALQNLRAVLSPAQQQKAQSLLGPNCFG